jgi:hypothetical protein
VDGNWVCTTLPDGCACDPATDATCLPAGRCWLDADCTLGWHCVGAVKCPEGAKCLVADHPGTCEPYAGDRPCAKDADCLEGETCPVNLDSVYCCPNLAPCAYGIPICTCRLDPATCANDAECGVMKYCRLTCGGPGCTGTCEAVPADTCVKDEDCGTKGPCMKGICPMCIPCPCFGKCAGR